jgi:hypothetical protein
MDRAQAKSAANELTMQEEIESWDENKLLLWIKQNWRTLPSKEEEMLKRAHIDGYVFLRHADDSDYFEKKFGLSLGVSLHLAEMATVLRELVMQTTSRKSTPFYIMDVMQTSSLQRHREQRTSRHYGTNQLYPQKDATGETKPSQHCSIWTVQAY